MHTHHFSDRPEGLPWARILKDLKQATKLTLDEVKTGGYGTFRAAYVYKDYSDGKYCAKIHHIPEYENMPMQYTEKSFGCKNDNFH